MFLNPFHIEFFVSTQKVNTTHSGFLEKLYKSPVVSTFLFDWLFKRKLLFANVRNTSFEMTPIFCVTALKFTLFFRLDFTKLEFKVSSISLRYFVSFVCCFFLFKRVFEKNCWSFFVKTTGSPISGCTCSHHNMYNILKGWQLPNGFWSVRTIYTNLHTKIFTLKHGKFEKKTYSGGTMTSLQHLTSIILL